MIGFLGALVLVVGMGIGVFGNWGLGAPVVSIGLALVTIDNVMVPPGVGIQGCKPAVEAAVGADRNTRPATAAGSDLFRGVADLRAHCKERLDSYGPRRLQMACPRDDPRPSLGMRATARHTGSAVCGPGPTDPRAAVRVHRVADVDALQLGQQRTSPSRNTGQPRVARRRGHRLPAARTYSQACSTAN